MFFNKTLLFPSLKLINQLLQNPCCDPREPSWTPYTTKYAIKHYQIRSENVIRIWKTQSLFDLWYDDLTAANFIAALDYTMNRDHIKINYMAISDDYYAERCPDHLTNAESANLHHSMLEFLKSLARADRKSKIIKDVHHSLEIYNKYYKPERFVVTDRISDDNNPAWLEAELIVDP